MQCCPFISHMMSLCQLLGLPSLLSFPPNLPSILPLILPLSPSLALTFFFVPLSSPKVTFLPSQTLQRFLALFWKA